MEITEILKEQGYDVTNHLENGLFLFPDGQVLQGDCFPRMHSHIQVFESIKECIKLYGNHNYEFSDNWMDSCFQLQIVILIPEDETALCEQKETLTKEQIKVLKNHPYKIIESKAKEFIR